MRAILTSWLGGVLKEDGKRLPVPLSNINGCFDKIREYWPCGARVMMVCADSEDHEKNDSVLECYRESLPMSGLQITDIDMIDSRNEELREADVLILTGGHVPTQNAFFEKIGLRRYLESFDGLLIAWSAGSMNCAEDVYAGPEFEGEAIDPNYRRWIKGLGITKVNIFPHFQSLRYDMLDGMRLIEDITFPDSMGHEILALNDGSYIVIEDGSEELFGEAYRILDGKISKICDNGVSVRIS